MKTRHAYINLGKRYGLTFLLFLLGAANDMNAAPFRCNIGVADITPESSVILAGFAAREGLSNGVHMPLKTHCLVIEDDANKVCVITNDLMEVPIIMADGLRDEISLRTGISPDHIFIHEIHTHSAPRVSGKCSAEGGTNYNYAKKTFQVIVDNAVKTINDKAGFRPFSIEVGKATSDINVNRGEKNGFCDHDVYVVRFIDEQSNPIVSLINYSCHPVSLNHRSLLVSTDFPGITTNELAKTWGGEVFYFTGASGNVNPSGGLKADTLYTQQKGKLLADAIRIIHFSKITDNNTLRVVTKEVRLPFRINKITTEAVNKHAEEISEWNISKTWKDDVAAWRKKICDKIANNEVKNYLPSNIGAVKVGGIVLLFSQGEPFNEYQTILRESFPGIPILFIAYTNGQNSYLPDRNAYTGKSYAYEVDQMHVYIGSPYPLSSQMPSVYESAIKNVVKKVLK